MDFQISISLISISPRWLGTVKIVLDWYRLFWSGQNHFGQVQIIFFWINVYNFDLSKMIWAWPKQIVPIHNDWYSTKIIWTVQNNFQPIEGQGIRLLHVYQKVAKMTNTAKFKLTSFMDCKYSTILDLWKGSTRANIFAFETAARCSETLRSSNSRPE